jgi:heptosyltransferase III
MRDDNIFDVLKREEEHAARRYHQGLIIQPGALGDCILTLPLARFMLEELRLQSLDIVGHSEYISIFPGRTCVSKIRSMEAIPFHRLFTDHRNFDLEEHDPLVPAFAPYEWIATFLGGEDTDFEKNLIYTSNCTSGTDVTSIDLKAPSDLPCHIAEYYIRQFVHKNREHIEPVEFDPSRQLIAPMRSDASVGQGILDEAGLGTAPIVIVQPGSSGTRKNWAIDNFVSVVGQLRQEGFGAAFLLGPAEMQNLPPTTLEGLADTAPCLSGLILAEVVASLSRATAFLGNDSGITHLAAAMGIPTVAIFGPSSPSWYKPIGPRAATFNMSAEEFARSDGSLSKSIVTQIISLAGR